MLEQLKKEVYEANMELQKKGLVIYTAKTIMLLLSQVVLNTMN